MNSYKDMAEWIGKGRNGTDRPLANNTRAHLYEDRATITLHGTDVVTYWKNGDVSFDSGGWRTMTTRDRMGYERAFSVFSDKGIWYIIHRANSEATERRLRRKFGLPVLDHEWPESWGEPCGELARLGSVGPRGAGYGFWQEVGETIGFKEAAKIYREYTKQLRDRTRYLFFDGIRFTKRGRCVNGIPAAKAAAKVKAQEKLRQQIIEFAKGAVDHLDQGPHPLFNRGDCFYCQMVVADEPEDNHHGGRASNRGKPLGDATGNHDHLMQHIEESYYPAALLRNAVLESPYTPIGQSMTLGVTDGDDGQMMGGLSGSEWRPRNHEAERIATAVYQYMGRRLLSDRELRSPFGGMSKITFPIKEGVKA